MPTETETAKVEEHAAETAETQEPKGATPEDLEGLKRAYRNKQEEAERLHKRVEKFEAEEAERKRAAMTEVERLTAEKNELAAKTRLLELSQLKRDAADKAGLPVVFADRLKGETPEELDADAQAMLGAMPRQPEAKKPPQPKIGNTAPGEAAYKSEMTPDERREFLYGKH